MTPSVQNSSFVLVVALVTAAFVWLLLPFYSAVMWAVILAIMFTPLQRRLVRRLHGRRNLAAAISLIACIYVVLIPGILIISSLVQETTDIYSRLSNQEFDLSMFIDQIHDALPSYAVKMLSVLDLGNLEQMQASFTSFLTEAAQAVTASAVNIGQVTAQFFISLGVMLYVLFFLFRDGPWIASAIRKASPLSDFHTDHILGKFTMVLKATVKGNFIIAMIQGAIGGITFWLLGMEAALLWGVLMAVLSLLPAVGAFLVWAPVALYLLLIGDYTRGIILVVVGIFVISLIDNFLRPLLVGKDTRLPDYVIFVSTLGGISLFGINGFVIGPLIAALFIAVWSLVANKQS